MDLVCLFLPSKIRNCVLTFLDQLHVLAYLDPLVPGCVEETHGEGAGGLLLQPPVSQVTYLPLHILRFYIKSQFINFILLYKQMLRYFYCTSLERLLIIKNDLCVSQYGFFNIYYENWIFWLYFVE